MTDSPPPTQGHHLWSIPKPDIPTIPTITDNCFECRTPLQQTGTIIEFYPCKCRVLHRECIEKHADKWGNICPHCKASFMTFMNISQQLWISGVSGEGILDRVATPETEDESSDS